MTDVWILSDLDDTLFQTARRRDPGPHGRVVAIAPDGSPGSYQCARQQALFSALCRVGTLVPVTARTTRGLARVTLPFTSWRVASNGAVILRPDGTEDAEWAAIAGARIDAALPTLREARDRLGTGARLLEDAGRPAYVVLKGAAPRPDLPAGLHVFATDESVVVTTVTKRDAVAFLLAHRLPADRVVLGFGDGPADEGFLALCDYAGWPVLNTYANAWRR